MGYPVLINQIIDLKKYLRWNIKQLWIPEGLQMWSTDQCALQCFLEHLPKNTDVQLLLLSLMKIRGWGLFPLLLWRVPHSQRKKAIKKKKKRVSRFLWLWSWVLRGGDLFLGVIRDLGTPLPTFTIWRASPICSITHALLPLRFPCALSFISQFCSKVLVSWINPIRPQPIWA